MLLGKVQKLAPEDVKRLKQLASRDNGVGLAARVALAIRDDASSEDVERLVGAVDPAGADVLEVSAAFELAKAKSEGLRLLVRIATDSKDHTCRYFAVEHLGMLGAGAAKAIPALHKTMRMPDRSVAESAVHAVRHILGLDEPCGLPWCLAGTK